MKLNRRTFMQGVAATLFGGVTAAKVKRKSDDDKPLLYKLNEDGSVEVVDEKSKFPKFTTRELEKVNATLETSEFPVGTTQVTGDGCIFIYVRHSEQPGNFVNANGFQGVAAENGWAQTYGPCMINGKGLGFVVFPH